MSGIHGEGEAVSHIYSSYPIRQGMLFFSDEPLFFYNSSGWGIEGLGTEKVIIRDLKTQENLYRKQGFLEGKVEVTDDENYTLVTYWTAVGFRMGSRTVLLFDNETRKTVFNKTILPNIGGVTGLSPKGDTLFFTNQVPYEGGKKSVTVHVYDIENSTYLNKFNVQATGYPTFAKYSPDGEILVFAFDNGRVNFYDPDTGEEIYSLRAYDYSQEAWVLTFSDKGDFLATLSSSGLLKVWGVKP